MKHVWLCLTLGLAQFTGCHSSTPTPNTDQPTVQLITLDPGHFHAALVQKTMYPQVDPEVHIYAPAGPDLDDHLSRINGFNKRETNPTAWHTKVNASPTYLSKMLEEKPGNVVVISGNNAKKTDYILASVNAGLNVLADKPMVISPEKFPTLVSAFQRAQAQGVLLYDIMTERYEITTILQKELAQVPNVFGQLQTGSPQEPAITKESVHHFFKQVAGKPIKRPAWFFDEAQRGEALVDVSTHLVDLVQWECFSEQIIDYTQDIQMVAAQRWTTPLSIEQFEKVTYLRSIPDYLRKNLKNRQLWVYSNGEIIYQIKGIYAKVAVTWKFQAPEGTSDTHTSIMRGTRSNLVIQQGAKENYKPTLYVEALPGEDLENSLHRAVRADLQHKYPGIGLRQVEAFRWEVTIPNQYKIGHEAHFAQVTQKYLDYLEKGNMPAWEVPNMIAKYYITTEALKMAK